MTVNSTDTIRISDERLRFLNVHSQYGLRGCTTGSKCDLAFLAGRSGVPAFIRCERVLFALDFDGDFTSQQVLTAFSGVVCHKHGLPICG